MSARSTFYLVVNDNGRVISRCLIPNEMFPPAIPPGTRIIVPADGKGPETEVCVDLRKVSEPVNHVESIQGILAWSEPAQPSAAIRLDLERRRHIAKVDEVYAQRIAAVAGPLAALHAEKSRQAEAGGGPLVADEADRLAILANAERQNEAIAEIERQRRTVKALLRAAETDSEFAAALALIDDDERKPK